MLKNLEAASLGVPQSGVMRIAGIVTDMRDGLRLVTEFAPVADSLLGLDEPTSYLVLVVL